MNHRQLERHLVDLLDSTEGSQIKIFILLPQRKATPSKAEDRDIWTFRGPLSLDDLPKRGLLHLLGKDYRNEDWGIFHLGRQVSPRKLVEAPVEQGPPVATEPSNDHVSCQVLFYLVAREGHFDKLSSPADLTILKLAS